MWNRNGQAAYAVIWQSSPPAELPPQYPLCSDIAGILFFYRKQISAYSHRVYLMTFFWAHLIISPETERRIFHTKGTADMKIVSWNVNGIAACRRKGLLKFLSDTKPDIACFQEVKTKCALSVPGYRQYWNNAERPGYAGTLVLTRCEPITCKFGMGIDELDTEGRLIILEYKDYYVLNVYVPSLNTYSEPSRLEYRNKWDAAFREYISSLPKPVIVAGDCNVTRSYIDSYPENQRNNPDTPLFEPEIRANFEQLLSCGFVDVFRALYPEKEGAYTWWGPKNKDRKSVV